MKYGVAVLSLHPRTDMTERYHALSWSKWIEEESVIQCGWWSENEEIKVKGNFHWCVSLEAGE